MGSRYEMGDESNTMITMLIPTLTAAKMKRASAKSSNGRGTRRIRPETEPTQMDEKNNASEKQQSYLHGTPL